MCVPAIVPGTRALTNSGLLTLSDSKNGRDSTDCVVDFKSDFEVEHINVERPKRVRLPITDLSFDYRDGSLHQDTRQKVPGLC